MSDRIFLELLTCALCVRFRSDLQFGPVKFERILFGAWAEILLIGKDRIYGRSFPRIMSEISASPCLDMYARFCHLLPFFADPCGREKPIHSSLEVCSGYSLYTLKVVCSQNCTTRVQNFGREGKSGEDGLVAFFVDCINKINKQYGLQYIYCIFDVFRQHLFSFHWCVLKQSALS